MSPSDMVAAAHVKYQSGLITVPELIQALNKISDLLELERKILDHAQVTAELDDAYQKLKKKTQDDWRLKR